MGFYRIRYKTFKLTDYWTDYKPICTNKPGIIVSNHVSFFDMYMYLLVPENPSFLSKHSVKNLPVIGFFAKMHQTIFFNRKDKSERDRVLDIIGERVALAEQGKISPMVIFPEGTTENGRGLMKFKKGPFALEKPFIVYSLFYDSDFIPCLNLIDVPNSFFIFFSSFIHRITYYRIDQPIDPLYILKKNGRQPGEPDNWEVIARETKDLMSFAFGFEQDELSFKDKSDFECHVQGLSTE